MAKLERCRLDAMYTKESGFGEHQRWLLVLMMQPVPPGRSFLGPGAGQAAKIDLISLPRSTGTGLQQWELGHCEECIRSAPELDNWLGNL